MICPRAAPQDNNILEWLRSKHPTEDPVSIATSKTRAEQRTGITAFGEQEQQPNVVNGLLDAQNLFEEVTVKTVIKKVNPQSAEGPSGLRYSHLQAALCDELVEDFAAFATLAFSSGVCPKYSGHCTRALTFLHWGKRQDRWRMVLSCGELLTPSSATYTTGSWQTTSSPEASTG